MLDSILKGYQKSKQLMSQVEAQERVNMSDQEVNCTVPNIRPGDQTFPGL